jgi:DNA-3-methyladenine glycosylase II
MQPAIKLKAVKHLRKADPVLRGVIDQVGPCRLTRRFSHYQMLVRSILSQQISGNVANAIRGRLEAMIAPQTIHPESIGALSVDQLRSVGVSRQKAAYLLDLTEHVLQGKIRLGTIGRRSDEEVIAELIQVKGIGVWTAQMFLIFALGRPDVFPHDDLGVKQAIRKLYGLKELPDKAASHRIAEPWRPYASVASWYLWRSFEIKAPG